MAEDTTWLLDNHTAAKHVILKKYLSAWLPKLTRYNGRVLICDGFAGPGIYSKGEDGSPVIALRTFLDHSYREKMSAEIKYIFIESDKSRHDSLCQVIEEIGVPEEIDVTVIHDKYEQAFGNILDYLDEEDSKLAPTFAFIDPFGVSGVPLEIINRLMAHGSCEVLITFMVSYIHRFLSRPEFEFHCDQLFGCEDWRAANELRGQDRESFLRGLYQRQLESSQSGVGAKYVRFFTMKDSRNKTIYDLFFATNHRSGIDAMKDAMWNVDQTGAYSYSDATDPDQVTLFSSDPDWDQLFDMLVTKFGGQSIAWPDVEEAVRRTPFRILKRPFQAEAKRENSRLNIVHPEGKRRGTLNEHTVIRFAE